MKLLFYILTIFILLLLQARTEVVGIVTNIAVNITIAPTSNLSKTINIDNLAMKTVQFNYDVVRFIAKSGSELKKHLNSLTNKPAGVVYKGKMYINVSDIYSTPPIEIHAGITDANNRFMRGLYLSETKAGNLLEVNGNSIGRVLYEMDTEVSGLLDLTNAKVIEQLGITFNQMKQVYKDNDLQYEFTREVAFWAKNNGYSGIKYYGAQSPTNYTNYVIFEQTTVNSTITNIKTILW